MMGVMKGAEEGRDDWIWIAGRCGALANDGDDGVLMLLIVISEDSAALLMIIAVLW